MGSDWPSSNMSSVKWPWKVPATAIEEAWWKIPARRSLARSIGVLRAVDVVQRVDASSAVMS